MMRAKLVRLPGAAGHGRAPLSARPTQPAGALRARHLGLPPRRSAQRARADRRADPGAAEQSVFPRAQGPGAARRRPCRRRRSRRCGSAVQLSHNAPLIQIMLGAGADRDRQSHKYRRGGGRAAARRDAREPEAPEAYSQLAMAYGRKGDLANADLASAQAAFARGDIKTARQLADARQDPASRSARPPGCGPTTSSTSSQPNGNAGTRIVDKDKTS